jgi:catechol 2,3-dioxygenase-like lactoylglutathione lyase family enzyme
MPDSANRLVAVVVTTSDLDRAVALYRDGFGLDLHVGDHEGDDT